jgi:Domain of unknown function (DUF4333)
MTAQPNTRITTPFAPQNPQQMYEPPASPAYAQGYGPAFPPPFPPPPVPPAARRRSTGKVVGIVAAALVLLAGLGVGALILFGPRTVDPASVQQEIVRITQTAVQVTPAGVRCPADVTAEAGGIFTCTATVEQQPVTYTVRQDDDKGHLTITYDRLLKRAEVENVVAGQVGKDVDLAVKVDCAPAGQTVIVNAPGTPIVCTATNASDDSDSAKINVTVSADGTPSYTFA